MQHKRSTQTGGAALKRRASSPIVVLLPFEPGRKTRHLALVTHRGGGWYDVQCMGTGKRCKTGTCHHVARMRFDDSVRPIRQVARHEKGAA